MKGKCVSVCMDDRLYRNVFVSKNTSPHPRFTSPAVLQFIFNSHRFIFSVSPRFSQGTPGLKGGEGPQGPPGPVVSMIVINNHASHGCKLHLSFHYPPAVIPRVWREINTCQSSQPALGCC